ncbi:hypothetical protein [Calothrix sp. CCY 0018]|uniref:hypothetical protein n=1 Tax=Calothrix sp. CCY 0018 TaxID=3103864 RepID=UPI0039C673B1
MSFDTYKNIGEVLKEYNISSTEENFIIETAILIRETFQEELTFSLREFNYQESEYAICEAIIFPVLKELYRSYRDQFTLWSHKALVYDDKLSGIPDYLLAKKSALGKEVFERPFFVAVEAKKDDFIKGWGQCLSEMVAIQKINDSVEQSIFGIVSNGQVWQFGKLTDSLFTKEINLYTISDLHKLFAALNFVFKQCEIQLEFSSKEDTNIK